MSLLAYLDPGSGSVLLQALLGGVAAIAITGKLWWARLLSILRIRRPDDSNVDQDRATDEPSAENRAS